MVDRWNYKEIDGDKRRYVAFSDGDRGRYRSLVLSSNSFHLLLSTSNSPQK